MCFLILLTDLEIQKRNMSEEVAGLETKLKGHTPTTPASSQKSW